MRIHIYGDESGNFDFSRSPDATRYFILTTVVVGNHDIEADLSELRRRITWDGFNAANGFHATVDKQRVRDQVFAVLRDHDVRIDATVLEKCKAQPQVRESEERFYQYAWYYHMKNLTPRIAAAKDEMLVIGASIGTKKRRAAFDSALTDVMNQVSGKRSVRTAMWTAASDPCLQIADYCSWAIRRKWERSDYRSYQLISNKIRSEYDLFKSGTDIYY